MRLPSMQISERPSSESDAFRGLLTDCARLLEDEAERIAQRWSTQLHHVEPPEHDTEDGSRVVVGAGLVRAIGRALVADAGTSEDAVGIGLPYGADAFSRGVSLHHMLKGLHLLEAMILFSIESDLGSRQAEGLSVASGVQLARRLARFSSLAMMAAARGYTQAVSDEMRDRFRHLRHDLRNPLGTIKSVLTLMDDQSIPAEARAHPRFRAMASRNASSLDDLIAARLSDAEAMLPSLAHQRVSLRTIACNVRRELRAEADRRGVTIVVGPDPGRLRIDGVGVELLLHELVHAALQGTERRENGEGSEELRISFDSTDRLRVVVRLESTARPAPIADPRVLAEVRTLAVRLGATLRWGDALALELPVHHAGEPVVDLARSEASHRAGESAVADDVRSDVSIEAAVAPLRNGQSRHDVGGASEREDRQPRLE